MKTSSHCYGLWVLAGLIFSLAPELHAQLPPADPARHRREYRDFTLGREGNITRGEELFRAERRFACVTCHSIDGTSSKVGPDLYAVGDKFPRREMIRELLEPSANIAVGYGTTTVITKSGDEYTGIIKSSTVEGVELALADGRRIRVVANEIKEQRGSNVSLMPEGWHTLMSRDEFSDLIEYLCSLRQPENALTSNLGMPNVISELAQPVKLVPMVSEELRFPHSVVQKPGDIRSGLVWFGQLPGLPGSFLAVHQTGKIWLLEKNKVGLGKMLFADIAPDIFNERGPNGLLGLAFHPHFRENRKYYLKHQVFEAEKIVTTVVERLVSADFRTDSGTPSRRLWKVEGTTQDHTGGCLAFGLDGFLYIAMGDTGPQQDPQGHGQDLTTHLGKILRLDVDHSDPGMAYAIPPDNPFRERANARPEIWASGFREPWRFSFDSVTGDLWVGDVGQDRVEEVSIVRRGENHGWNVYEGFEPFSNVYRRDGEKYVPPVFAYKRKYGNSVTGGLVYRGDRRSSFYGVYICGDYTSHRIWGLTQEGRRLKLVRQIGMSPQGIASFGSDERGEIYLVGYEGMVYHLDFSATAFDGPTIETSKAPPAVVPKP